MEHPNQIDEQFRKRLQDASAAPPAFVWPQVEAALRKRRRRILFFWWFGLGIAGAGILGWWMRSGDLQKDSAAPIVVQEQQITPSTKPAASEKTRSMISSRESVSDNKGVDHHLVPTDHIAVPQTENHPAFMAGQPEKDKQYTTRKDLPVVTVQGGALPAHVTPETRVSDDPLVAATTTEGLAHQENILMELLSPLQPLQITTLLHPHLFALPHPPGMASAPASRIVRNKKETRNCYDFNGHPHVFLLDAYLGPSLTRKDLQTGPDNQPYLALRRKTESHDWAFSAGLRASLLLDRHFLIRSGLHYDQLTEKFEFIDPNYVQVIIRNTTQIINGQPVTVTDTLGVQYGENYLKSYNRFGMLDIPLEAGIELRNGRTGLSINGGFALNVLFWKRGAIISPVDGQPAYFTPGKRGAVDVFRTRAGLSAIGSIQWFCHLRPRLRVFAEPCVRMVLRPVNVPGHPVEQRYGMVGLNVGMTRILD